MCRHRGNAVLLELDMQLYSKAPHLRNHLKETFSLPKNNQPRYLQETLEACTQNKICCVLSDTKYWSDSQGASKFISGSHKISKFYWIFLTIIDCIHMWQIGTSITFHRFSLIHFHLLCISQILEFKTRARSFLTNLIGRQRCVSKDCLAFSLRKLFSVQISLICSRVIILVGIP